MSRHLPRRPVRGLSIVELMVGITVGLFITAAASLITVNQMNDNRRLLLEAQVQQDVRIAADLIARDLRRAGYWARAHRTVWPTDMATALSNPYTDLDVTATSITFARSLDEEGVQQVVTENNVVDTDEVSGYRYNAAEKTIEVLLSDGNWQTLTDPAVIQVDRFAVRVGSTDLAVPCGQRCPATGPGGCPLRLTVRDATIEIEAHATADPRVTRSMRSDVRLRNDVVREVCAP